jgi:hypothetical protein
VFLQNWARGARKALSLTELAEILVQDGQKQKFCVPLPQHVTGQKKPAKMHDSFVINIDDCANFFTQKRNAGTFLASPSFRPDRIPRFRPGISPVFNHFRTVAKPISDKRTD